MTTFLSEVPSAAPMIYPAFFPLSRYSWYISARVSGLTRLDCSVPSTLTLSNQIPELDWTSLKYRAFLLTKTISTLNPFRKPTDFCDTKQVLRNALRNDSWLESYDYILIYCPPSLGMLIHNALAAADGIIVPEGISPKGVSRRQQMFSVYGLIQFEQVVNTIRRKINKDLNICGIVETMVDNTKMTKEVDEVLSREYADLVYSTKITRRIEAAYSSADRKSFISSKKFSEG